MKQIGRRINLSFDAISVKRLICKRCNSLLLPENSRQRLVPRRQSHVLVTCKHCGAKRRYVNRERNRQKDKKTTESSIEPPTTNEQLHEQQQLSADTQGVQKRQRMCSIM